MTEPRPFLQIKSVSTHFESRRGRGIVKAVDDVSLELAKGEILGLVGESGCGKTTLSRTIMQMLKPQAGSIFLEGRDLSTLSAGALRRARLNFQMIFQDPYASLNPRLTVYDTLAEAISTRGKLKRSLLLERVGALMEQVGLSPSHMKKYPHEFSGGQRQRIAVARALAPEPKLIIADEPVSALDVSIQSQILNLLYTLSRELNLTMIFISHDLSVVKYISDRIAVMYLGKLVELGSSREIMDNPIHYYTKSLISAIPTPTLEKTPDRMLLQGDPPSPSNPPEGCAFAYRSPKRCAPEVLRQPGVFREVKTGHWVEVHPGTVDDDYLL